MTREQLDAIRARYPAHLRKAMVSMGGHAWDDAYTLLAEVERLTAERDAAFQRGVAAMREAAAKECWNASDELADVPDMESEQGTLQNVATRIRAIPDPKDTP